MLVSALRNLSIQKTMFLYYLFINTLLYFSWRFAWEKKVVFRQILKKRLTEMSLFVSVSLSERAKKKRFSMNEKFFFALLWWKKNEKSISRLIIAILSAWQINWYYNRVINTKLCKILLSFVSLLLNFLSMNEFRLSFYNF